MYNHSIVIRPVLDNVEFQISGEIFISILKNDKDSPRFNRISGIVNWHYHCRDVICLSR